MASLPNLPVDIKRLLVDRLSLADVKNLRTAFGKPSAIDRTMLQQSHRAEFGNDGLLRASREGDVGLVEICRSVGCSVEARNTELPHANMLNRTLYYGEPEGATPIIIAAAAGFDHVVWELLKEEEYKPVADMYAVDVSGMTALHWAVRNDHRGVVRILMTKAGAERHRLVETADSRGRTPILVGVEMHRMDVVGMLINNGADVCATDHNGDGVVSLLSRFDDSIELFRCVIKVARARLGQCYESERPVGALSVVWDCVRADCTRGLVGAVKRGHWDNVTLLVESFGADVGAVDEGGDTMLHIAARGGFWQILCTILDDSPLFRVHVDQRNFDGDTPLHVALRGRHADAVEVLIDRGADVNALDGGGDSPLSIAVAMSNKKLPVLEDYRFVLTQNDNLGGIGGGQNQGWEEFRTYYPFRRLFCGSKRGFSLVSLLLSYPGTFGSRFRGGRGMEGFAVDVHHISGYDEDEEFEVVVQTDNTEALSDFIRGGFDIRTWDRKPLEKLKQSGWSGDRVEKVRRLLRQLWGREGRLVE